MINICVTHFELAWKGICVRIWRKTPNVHLILQIEPKINLGFCFSLHRYILINISIVTLKNFRESTNQQCMWNGLTVFNETLKSMNNFTLYIKHAKRNGLVPQRNRSTLMKLKEVSWITRHILRKSHS